MYMYEVHLDQPLDDAIGSMQKSSPDAEWTACDASWHM